MRTPSWARSRRGSASRSPIRSRGSSTWTTPPGRPRRGGGGGIECRGPEVMKGYWNKPEDTAAVLRDGWLLTGDVARMDEDGYFYIVDRKKDMILCSGYNVYPRG